MVGFYSKPSTPLQASVALGDPAEPVKQLFATTKVADDLKAQELERENLDLKITNRAKDIVIERMQKERDGFINQLLASSQMMGQLETKLHRLDGFIKLDAQEDAFA